MPLNSENIELVRRKLSERLRALPSEQLAQIKASITPTVDSQFQPINNLEPQTVSFDQPPIGRISQLPSTGQELLPVTEARTFQPPPTNPFFDDTPNPEIQLAQLNTGLQRGLTRGGGIFPKTRPDSRTITELHQLLEDTKNKRLGPLSRPAEFATPLGGVKTGVGAVTGLVGMAAEVEQFFNPTEGDTRGRGDKILEFAMGILDMPYDGALQATAVVEDVIVLGIEKATGERLANFLRVWCWSILLVFRVLPIDLNRPRRMF